MKMYANAVRDITTDIKHFDSSKKHNCAIFGGKNHSFADFSELLNSKLKQAYIKNQLAANKFRNTINRLDHMNGNKCKGDVNLLRACNLHSLDHLTEVPSHAVQFLTFNKGGLTSLEAQPNIVATTVSKSSDVILDFHQVVKAPNRLRLLMTVDLSLSTLF